MRLCTRENISTLIKDPALRQSIPISKTNLFKYTEIFTTQKMLIFKVKILIFFHISVKT